MIFVIYILHGCYSSLAQPPWSPAQADGLIFVLSISHNCIHECQERLPQLWKRPISQILWQPALTDWVNGDSVLLGLFQREQHSLNLQWAATCPCAKKPQTSLHFLEEFTCSQTQFALKYLVVQNYYSFFWYFWYIHNMPLPYKKISWCPQTESAWCTSAAHLLTAPLQVSEWCVSQLNPMQHDLLSKMSLFDWFCSFFLWNLFLMWTPSIEMCVNNFVQQLIRSTNSWTIQLS